ncbi:response regulator [Sulfurimonas sp.]|uniref:response regulator n=1 Tax=Sulfurimonas sp. TaxID=2022749 RepID=UPI002608CD01|nr:response regulator [Sulfurimonas sp.]
MAYNLKIYESLNILCVEDDESIRTVYDAMFSLVFKNIYLAENGKEGLKIFQKEKIDMVLTDYSMPIMDGLEMSRQIREIDATIPIIMITAIENINMLRDAIDIRITSFIKKPISSQSIFDTLEFVAKSVLAERLLVQLQKEKLLYGEYQENLTYEKETKIIKNDVVEERFLNFDCEVFFQPRDTLSGDSYSIRKVDEERYFAFIVDGMGKGISASVTAMMCCAYTNHIVNEIMLTKELFSLSLLIQRVIKFLAPNLLEYEVVSASFLLFDGEKNELEYAMFSMPAMLYVSKEDKSVHKLKSNNPPLSACTNSVNSNKILLSNIDKFLFFSDGVNENMLKESKDTYAKFLNNDFFESANLKEFEAKRVNRIEEQEDDVTYIYLKNGEK